MQEKEFKKLVKAIFKGDKDIRGFDFCKQDYDFFRYNFFRENIENFVFSYNIYNGIVIVDYFNLEA